MKNSHFPFLWEMTVFFNFIKNDGCRKKPAKLHLYKMHKMSGVVQMQKRICENMWITIHMLVVKKAEKISYTLSYPHYPQKMRK